MRDSMDRREMIRWALLAAAGTQVGPAALAGTRHADGKKPPFSIDGRRVKDTTFAFILKCARKDGGYSPSPDPNYPGCSDTGESDLAAVTYAATLSKPESGWNLPHKQKSVEFIQNHQQPDGVFVNHGGKMDPKGELAILYNTVQGVVSLRALGAKPKVNPVKVMDRFFEGGHFAKLPWYTRSFYPLFYAAAGAKFPHKYCEAIKNDLIEHQAADGYLQDAVASTYHLTHFFRLIGEKPPKIDQILERVLRDQRPDGGWQLKPPAWDVHSCFDAVFILRQFGWNQPRCRAAISKAAKWAMSCQNPDGGFAHFPRDHSKIDPVYFHSDMDSVYFNFGTLVQAELIPGTNYNLPDAETLSWGHAMKPGKIYRYP